MRIVCFVLFGAAIVFCALGLSGHREAWAAAALCFFAAIMVIVGRCCDTKDGIYRERQFMSKYRALRERIGKSRR